MISKLLAGLFRVGLCFASLLTVHAATFSLNPTLDAFVTTGASANLSNNNYGGAGALSVAAAGLSQGEFQSVLQFNLAAAKSAFDSQFGTGSWTVQSVTLQLTAAPPNNGIFNASAAGAFNVSWMQNDGWTEGSGTPQTPTTTGITFATLSNFVSAADQALGTFAFNGATSGAFGNSLKLTPFVSSDILSGDVFSLRLFAADSAISYLSDSRNFGTASSRPLLSITAVPEPAPLMLALFGLALCVCSYQWRRVSSRRA